MRKLFFISSIFLFLLYSFSASAQVPEHVRRNIIKTNPMAMLQGPIIGFGEYRLMYERALTPSHAIVVSLGYLGKGIFGSEVYSNYSFSNPFSTVSYQGYRVMAGYKFYVDAYAPSGWYLMPLGSYAYGKMSSSYDPPQDYITATYINVTGNIGYQWLIDDRLAMDLYAGLGWKSNIWRGYGQYYKAPDLPTQFTAAKFTLGFNMGIAF